MQRTRQIKKVLYITLFLNLIVSAAKIIYGYLSDSVAIMSDGYHSIFDGISNIVGLIAITLSSHPPDSQHPYGHRKIETIFTICIGLFMLFACFEIFKNAYNAFYTGIRPSLGLASFLVMLITLGFNIIVVTYEKKMAVSLQSEFLLADSKHTLSDIYVTLGVIIGLALQMSGFVWADALTGVVVGMLVAYTGVKIIIESADVLIDRNQTDSILIKELVCKHSGVIECHEIRTRGAKSNVFLDLHVVVEPQMSVSEAHKIAHEVEDTIRKSMPEIVDIVVHVEPMGDFDSK